MRILHHSRSRAGFTKLELWIVVVVVAGLGLLAFLSARSRDRKIAYQIDCRNQLRAIAITFHLYANDNDGFSPWQLSTNAAGSREYVGTGQAWRHFAAALNELGTPVILTCKSDQRNPTRVWKEFNNSTLSYFISIDANETNSQVILMGDRNIQTDVPPLHGALALVANRPVRWRGEIHPGGGNIALADGSVQQVSTVALQNQANANPAVTNRIELP